MPGAHTLSDCGGSWVESTLTWLRSVCACLCQTLIHLYKEYILSLFWPFVCFASLLHRVVPRVCLGLHAQGSLLGVLEGPCNARIEPRTPTWQADASSSTWAIVFYLPLFGGATQSCLELTPGARRCQGLNQVSHVQDKHPTCCAISPASSWPICNRSHSFVKSQESFDHLRVIVILFPPVLLIFILSAAICSYWGCIVYRLFIKKMNVEFLLG